METNRKAYIDISKGIGIFGVVLVHLTVRGSWLSQVLLSFCVAIFFFISGLLFSIKPVSREFILKLTQRILIPLFLYSCIDAIFTMFWTWEVEAKDFSWTELVKIILKISFITGSANSNGPLWYLCTLFQVQLIFYILIKNKLEYKRGFQLLVLIIMFILGAIIQFKGPFRIGQIPLAFMLFTLGYMSKRIIEGIEKNKHKLYIGIFLVIVFGVCCWLNGFSELAARNYGNNYLLYYLTCLSIILAIIILSMCIKQNKILSYYGKNSLTVMCCHYYIARYFIPLIFDRLSIDRLLEMPVIEFALAICIMIIMVPFISFINRWCPVLCGKYKIRVSDNK